MVFPIALTSLFIIINRQIRSRYINEQGKYNYGFLTPEIPINSGDWNERKQNANGKGVLNNRRIIYLARLKSNRTVLSLITVLIIYVVIMLSLRCNKLASRLVTAGDTNQFDKNVLPYRRKAYQNNI